MQTMIYPVNGSVENNVKVTVLPPWSASFVSKTVTFIPAFRRLWVAPHLAPMIRSADELCRFDALIAQYNSLLTQQGAFPLGGIGWWIERLTSLKTRCEQDILAYGAYLASFKNEYVRHSIMVNLSSTYMTRYSAFMTESEFKQGAWDAAKYLIEVGGK